MDPLVSLAAASIALVGMHFALSHPLRAPLVKALGEGAFLGLYSLVAAACMIWMVFAFRAAPAADLGGATEKAGWIVSTVLILPALVLFIGSLWKNPRAAQPRRRRHDRSRPDRRLRRHTPSHDVGFRFMGAQPHPAVVELAHADRGQRGADPGFGRHRLSGPQEGSTDERGVVGLGEQDQLLAAIDRATWRGRGHVADRDRCLASAHLGAHWRSGCGCGHMAVVRLKPLKPSWLHFDLLDQLCFNTQSKFFELFAKCIAVNQVNRRSAVAGCLASRIR